MSIHLKHVAYTALCISMLLQVSVAQESAESLRMPRNWTLPPVKQHPCLLITPEETPACEERLVQRFGSIDEIGDETLQAYFSGDEAARKKATEDFIAYWKDYSKRWTPEKLDRERPDGVSMRGIRRCIFRYDLVASFGYLSDEQIGEFRDRLVASIELAIGSNAANPRITPNEGFRKMNIWTDVVAAAGMVGLAFPELRQSRDWVEFAVEEIGWQFDRVVWDGAWHESPRYHGAMITITGLFFESLQRRTGVDLFQNPQFKAMLDWFVRFQTPLDKVAGKELGHPEGVILAPALGDSSWTSVPYGLMATYAPHYAESDPAFAGRLMWAWERAGKPMEGDTVEHARELIRPELPAIPQMLDSDCSPTKGHIVMRSGFDTPDERWLLLRCGNATRSGHDNGDWNAFNLYAFGVPLALDAASGTYSHKSHKGWHDKSVAHNTVVFGDRTQSRKDGEILTWITTPEADYSVSDGSAAAGVSEFVRHVLFVKPDYFVIWDAISSNESGDWMLHTTATRFEWADHRVRCFTPWDVNLDVHVVWPDQPIEPGIKKGRIGNWTVEGGKKAEPFPFYYQNYFKIPNDSSKPFLTVLHPLKSGQESLTVKDISRSSGKPILEITCGDQKDRVELFKDSARITRHGPINQSYVLDQSKL
jgi:hypothetical protein